MLVSNVLRKTINFGPIILLYYLSVSEIDTNFENQFEILSFNIQLIIIYFWTLKNMNVLGNGHVFFAGIINDVIMGLPMGTSAMTYLSASFVALYIKNVTVKMTIFTDWFTFFIAIFFSNLVYYILIHNFSDLSVTYTYLFYNSLFTFLFFPLFWFFFTWYIAITGINRDD